VKNPTSDQPTVVIHPSIADTSAGKYVQARINICVLRDKAEQTEKEISVASAEAKATSSDAAFLLLCSLPGKLSLLRDDLDAEYGNAEELEDKTTVDAYIETLAKFMEAYEHASELKPLPPGDQKCCDAVLSLQERIEDDAEDWSEVSGSKEASWLDSALKAAALGHRVEKQEEHVKAIKEDTAPAPEEKKKRKRALTEKDKADRKEKTTNLAILDSLKQQHKTAQERADKLHGSIDPDKADELVDHDLKKLSKIRNLRPSVMIRKLLLLKIKGDLHRKREARRAARVEGIVEELIDHAEEVEVSVPLPGADLVVELQ